MHELVSYGAASPGATYFSPDSDVQVYDPDEEEWSPLEETAHSLGTLTEALETAEIDADHVRLDADAASYLEYHRDGAIGDDIHDDPALNRERLLALVDAGYSETSDLLGSDDPFDIESATGIDRDILSTLAARYAPGFTTASETSPGELADLSPRDEFAGWTLTQQTGNRIRWVTTGRFNLTLDASESSVSLKCNLPPESKNTWYRKGHTVELPPSDAATPESALEDAHSWLTENQIQPADDLATIPYIGPATRDYLYLMHGVDSFASLARFAVDQQEAFDAIFGTNGDAVRDALDDI